MNEDIKIDMGADMCDEKVEVYSRVVGYFRPISQWNAGKVEEFKDRKFYLLDTGMVVNSEAADIKMHDKGDKIAITR